MRLIFLLLIFFFGCQLNNEEHIKSYKIPKKLSFNNNEISSIPFQWDTPDYWIPSSKSSMRVASYLIPTSNGSADLSVIYLNGDGGGIPANVNRWREQLGLPKLSDEEIINNGESFSGNLGEYKIYEIINNNNDESAFLCSIIPAEDFVIFVKLNTYLENINKLKEEFIKYSSSFRYNE